MRAVTESSGSARPMMPLKKPRPSPDRALGETRATSKICATNDMRHSKITVKGRERKGAKPCYAAIFGRSNEARLPRHVCQAEGE